MKLLIVHTETHYFAGAETMLLYYLQGLHEANIDFAVASVENGRFWNAIPEGVCKFAIPDNSKFSIFQLIKQVSGILKLQSEYCYDILHAWAARDWEVTTLVGFIARKKAIGTLHDHPSASFHSKKRQMLMKVCSKIGLEKIVCVSNAVKKACITSNYPIKKLEVIHNGLPDLTIKRSQYRGETTIGFLGAISERKGLHVFLEIIDKMFEINSSLKWKVIVGGEALDEKGRAYLANLKSAFSTRSWWPRIQWLGWVKKTTEFLQIIDILVVPSTEFDPFPTVILEAGRAGVSVLASDVGGVSEIIDNGKNGWIYPKEDWRSAVLNLVSMVKNPDYLEVAGINNKIKFSNTFLLKKMVENYISIYSNNTIKSQ